MILCFLESTVYWKQPPCIEVGKMYTLPSPTPLCGTTLCMLLYGFEFLGFKDWIFIGLLLLSFLNCMP